ncbi:MAG TPA: hypothetical protein VLN59_02785 [Burkholderiales bacterium]|nr:hypothetical protein [Burkholderiales bacterium]
MTSVDYELGRLTDAITCQSESRPVNRDTFMRTAVVVMPGGRQVRPYLKGTIFGFRACDGSEVRFVRGANLRVVRALPMYLYEHEYRISMGNRGSRLVTEHAFSTAAADSVRSLTMNALKQAYPENHRFHDLLDLAFRGDDELIRYDEFHHEYRVARLLRRSRETLP